MSIDCGDGEFTVRRRVVNPEDLPERKGPQRAQDRRNQHLTDLAAIPAHSKRAWQIKARRWFEDAS